MLRPVHTPFDTFLGDAFSLDEAAFCRRYPWPMIVIPNPDPEVLLKIRRGETVIDGLHPDNWPEPLPAPHGASLDALCLEARPKPGRSAEGLSIGRSPDADVVLLDDSISRIHAMLAWNAAEERMAITDLGARNGTLLDGVHLPPETLTTVPAGAAVAFGALQTRLYTPRTFFEWLRSGAPRSGAAPGSWPQRNLGSGR